ncbi:hypothetical protein K7432_008736 [Basidiobolus ranarum]|uniref:Uncharacterized protein n=1 Tax=Basidiobolus ranarum TaxID=34480 RepID=A0ABR2VYH5_9FUNG
MKRTRTASPSAELSEKSTTDPELIQIRGGKYEVDQRLNNFIHLKRREIDESNRIEFLKRNPSSQGADTCARTDAVKLNRSLQMRIDVVNNDWGPLMRSMHHGTNEQNNKLKKTDMVTLSTGVEERLKCLEEHFNLKAVSHIPFNVYERLEALETHLKQLQEDFPPNEEMHMEQLKQMWATPQPRPPTPPPVQAQQSEKKADEKSTKPLFKRVGRGKDSSLARCVEEQLRKMELQKRTGFISSPSIPEKSDDI